MSYHSYYSQHRGHKGDPCIVLTYPSHDALSGTILHHESNGRSEHILVSLDPHSGGGTTVVNPCMCFRSLPQRITQRDAYGTFTSYIESDPAYRTPLVP